VIGYKTYQVIDNIPYIDTTSIVASRVLVVDRNGIGVKHNTSFSGTETVDVKTFEWYGLKQETASSTNYLIQLSNSIVGSDRQIILRVGPSPVPGFVYSIYYGTIIASYLVLAGDTEQDVRDGLIAAINGESWGTTFTTTAIGTNRIQLDITGTAINPSIQFGSQLYRKGYYVTIAGINYLLEEGQSTTGWPTLSAIGASYAYAVMIKLFGTVEQYLQQPLTVSNYSESVTGSTDITGIPSASGVTFNHCVVDELQQRIWFYENLNIGEIIKVIYR
jgi:hypothetical protein